MQSWVRKTSAECDCVSLAAKLHQHDEGLSLSNSVTLNGVSNKASSGEELIKTWILLSNFGHAQYTYGVERTLLQAAQATVEWLIGS